MPGASREAYLLRSKTKTWGKDKQVCVMGRGVVSKGIFLTDLLYQQCVPLCVTMYKDTSLCVSQVNLLLAVLSDKYWIACTVALHHKLSNRCQHENRVHTTRPLKKSSSNYLSAYVEECQMQHWICSHTNAWVHVSESISANKRKVVLCLRERSLWIMHEVFQAVRTVSVCV